MVSLVWACSVGCISFIASFSLLSDGHIMRGLISNGKDEKVGDADKFWLGAKEIIIASSNAYRLTRDEK